jgi:hypothetical protein
VEEADDFDGLETYEVPEDEPTLGWRLPPMLDKDWDRWGD